MNNGKKSNSKSSEGSKFLLLLDAYNEIKFGHKIYESKEIKRYDCKIIITSRRDYLECIPDYRKNFVKDEKSIKELIIPPLDQG